MSPLTEAQERSLLGQFPAPDVPAVLLPVRVETHFVTTGSRPEPLVRIYPDEVHVDAHEPELTADEVAWGHAFWEQTWRAGTGEAAAAVRRGVWERLVRRFGATRAAWIAEVLTPTNPGDRPGAPVADDEVLTHPPAFPRPGTRADAWTRPPRARLLPERWLFIGRRGGARVALVGGAPVQPDLAVGPDPAAGPPAAVGDDVLTIEPGLRWLVDFAAAEAAGMAVRVPLSADDLRLGFDTVFVVGLRTTPTPDAEADALEALVAAHRSTHGMATVPAGAVTNHLGEQAVTSPESDVTSPAERDTPTPPDTAGSVLAGALGIDAAALAPLAGASDGAHADTSAMQTLLWPATGGYFLEQLFAVGIDAAAARRHTVDHVRADGPLPVVRVGRQPYGVLPVTSLDRWPGDVTITWLRALRQRWRALTPRVPRLDRRPGTARPPSENEVLAVLRGGPSSAGYTVRVLHDHGIFGLPAVHTRVELPTQATQHAANLRALLTSLGVTAQPRLLTTVLGASSAELRDGNVVAAPGAPMSDAALFAWLTTSSALDIRGEVGLDAPPGHLLYLLARHAVLLTYAAVAAELQRATGNPTAAIDPGVVDVTEAHTSTLGRRLDGPFPGLSKSLHQLTAADHPAASRLDDLRAALGHLATLPPARLAELVHGTLDVFAYRLDAWVTSLATRRLSDLRAVKGRGAVVGGYGWLEDVRPRQATMAAAATPGEPAPLFVDPASAGFVHAPSLNQAATAALLRSGYAGAIPTTGAPATNAFAVDLSSRRVRLAEWILDGVRAGQHLGALLGERFERALHDRRLDGHIPAFRRVAPFGDVAVAEAAFTEAKDEADRLRATPHPNVLPAQKALAAAKQHHDNLVKERDAIPGQLKTVQTKLTPLQAQRSAAIAELARIQKLLARQPLNEPLSEQLLQVEADLKMLDLQIKPLQEQVARLTKRQGELPGLITAAAKNVTTAQTTVDSWKAKPHPDLAKAVEAEKQAAENLKAVLDKHRAERLFPPTALIEVMEATAATSLVDGLALARLHEQRQVPFGRKKLPASTHADHAPLVAELDALVGMLDAVADALTAESVHQIVLGNPERAGASLDAVARRQVPPPELEFARTPRTGTPVTHRVALAVPAPDRLPEDWSTGDDQIRALAEPALHAWAATLLGDPRRIRADVTWVAADGAVVADSVLRLDALGIGPLDVVAMIGETGDPRPELADLLDDVTASQRPEGVLPEHAARLRFGRGSSWAGDERSLAESFEVARAIGDLVRGARALAPSDLAPAGEPGTAAIDVAELQDRADAVVASATRAREQLTDSTDADADARRIARSLGITGAIPDELDRRLDAVAALGDEPAAIDDASAVSHAAARIQAVLGSSFVVLPRLAGGDELAAAVADGDERFDGDNSAPETWLAQMATVRPAIERLQTVDLYAAACGHPSGVTVAQLPFTAGERWIALPAEPGTDVVVGRTSIVLNWPAAPDLTAPFAGLFVDEWVEVVPGAREVTGVTCNVDEPGAQPPQAILVAVAPPNEPHWGIDVLEAIVLETLDLAKLRAVTPELLSANSDVEQILPAVYVAYNELDDTVSTDFFRAMVG